MVKCLCDSCNSCRDGKCDSNKKSVEVVVGKFGVEECDSYSKVIKYDFTKPNMVNDGVSGSSV